MLILVFSFVPFFAFIEIGEAIGWQRLTALLFARRDAMKPDPLA